MFYKFNAYFIVYRNNKEKKYFKKSARIALILIRNNKFSLKNKSQGCAIESAALHHPKRDIFLLIATPVGYPSDKKLLSPIVRALQHYPNIHFRNVNMQKFVNDTPVEKWFHTGELFSSWYIVEHTSDFLRLLTLYRFGGTVD